jgi:hypothetical protein
MRAKVNEEEENTTTKNKQKGQRRHWEKPTSLKKKKPIKKICPKFYYNTLYVWEAYKNIFLKLLF